MDNSQEIITKAEKANDFYTKYNEMAILVQNHLRNKFYRNIDIYLITYFDFSTYEKQIVKFNTDSQWAIYFNEIYQDVLDKRYVEVKVAINGNRREKICHYIQSTFGIKLDVDKIYDYKGKEYPFYIRLKDFDDVYALCKMMKGD